MAAETSMDVLGVDHVDLTVEGLHNVPRDRACVFMSNHQSNIDIPILYSVFPGTLRMVAKAELFKVPLWGRAMKEAGFVRVTRSGDRAEAMAAMAECGDAIARGINVWIAPEGTRSLDGRVAKFKKGGFILARDAGADIVPVAIDGSRAMLPKNTRVIQRGARVNLRERRMRVRAAHEREVQHAGQDDVGDVGGASGDQARVFLALDLGAHELRRRDGGGGRSHVAKDKRRTLGEQAVAGAAVSDRSEAPPTRSRNCSIAWSGVPIG